MLRPSKIVYFDNVNFQKDYVHFIKLNNFLQIVLSW